MLRHMQIGCNVFYLLFSVSLLTLGSSIAWSGQDIIPPRDAISNQVLNLISPEVLIDSQVTQQVSKIGHTLLRDYDTTESAEYRFHVFYHPSPNAFSIPSGDIFITTGLLDLLESKDQLAIVLGREIAFLEQDIGWRFFQREKAKETMVFVSQIILVGVIMYFQVSAQTKTQPEDSRGVSYPTYTGLYNLAWSIPEMVLDMSRNARLRKAQLPPALMMGREKCPTSLDMLFVRNIGEGYGESVELAGDTRSLGLATNAGWNSKALISLLEKLVPTDPSRMSHLRSCLGKRIFQAEKEIQETKTPVGSEGNK